MEFYDVIKSRRSIRGYKNDEIPSDVIARIAEAVNLAPSACNKQPWKFKIIMNAEQRAEICKHYSQPWLKEAPAIVVALGNFDDCWKRPQENTPITEVDTSIAMEHLVLAATAEGLGTCWICAYDRAEMDSALGVSAPWSVLAITPLGYPAAEPRELSRKAVTDVVMVVK